LTKIPCPAGSSGRFRVRFGSNATIQDTTINTVQDTRNATNGHIPRGERAK
jgi:hypothetical protein